MLMNSKSVAFSIVAVAAVIALFASGPLVASAQAFPFMGHRFFGHGFGFGFHRFHHFGFGFRHFGFGFPGWGWGGGWGGGCGGWGGCGGCGW
jgi:hypothetical protein